MTGCVQFRGSGEERRQGVTPSLIAQDVDEFDAGRDLSGDVPDRPVAVDGALQELGRFAVRMGR